MTLTTVEVSGLCKYFAVASPVRMRLLGSVGNRRRICVLDQVNLGIHAGEVVGLVGANGAGKTTLMRILADVMEPDAGWVAIDGERMMKGKHRVRLRIGYVSSDERSFFWRLTGRQNLMFFAALYGVSRADAEKRMGYILDTLGVAGRAEQLFRDYSSGIRKKFALARALIHCPQVVLLDELTNSLDPPSAQKVKQLVREYVCECEGRVGLWSTHRHEEISEICDRAIVIENGKVEPYEYTEDMFKQPCV